MVRHGDITVFKTLCYLIKLRVIHPAYTSAYLSLPAALSTAVKSLTLTRTLQLRVILKTATESGKGLVYRVTAPGAASINAFEILKTRVIVALLSLLNSVLQVPRMVPRGCVVSLCLVQQVPGERRLGERTNLFFR
jgi:hypothetical protein